MTLLDDLRARRAEILALALRHGARNLRVFGSVARREERADSDIDFLVVFPAERSLFDQVGLKQDLEDVLGRTVDVVSEGALGKGMSRRVLAEATAL